METYRQIIKENIDYDVLSVNLNRDAAMLDEIVDLYDRNGLHTEIKSCHCRRYLPGGNREIKAVKTDLRAY